MKYFLQVLIFTFIFLQANLALAEIRLPHLINNGMVLQRESEIEIWGWAEPNEEVFVEFRGTKQQAITNAEGKWSLFLKPMEAGGPFTMEVYSQKDRIDIEDIWIGDVWLCSGQSNMETTMERVEPMFPEEFLEVDNLMIRYFDVPDDYSFEEVRTDLKGGKWLALNDENIRSYAAVAYFFAQNIHQKYNIPIGIINASVGGSPIQAWLREQDLKQFPEEYQEASYFKKPGVIAEIERTDREKMNEWRNELKAKDLGLSERKEHWLSDGSNDWKLMEELDLLPQENGRPVNGVYWFKKKFRIDSLQTADAPGKLLLGTLIDSDEAYINGVLVGSTGYRYPPRRYVIPEGVIEVGVNTLLIRIVSERGTGGFITEKPYKIEIGDQVIDLSQDWKYKIGAKMPAAPSQTAVRLKPMGLYNAMIAPLHRTSITGILWYQGESNTGQGAYGKQLKFLIEGWRDEWARPELPFIFVQLPNFMEVASEPQESSWAEMREIQRKSLTIPNTGMSIIIDAGEANDIHPLDKKTVGNRLALQAQKLVYGETSGPFSGPLIHDVQVKNDEIIITFTEVGEGLSTADNTSLGGFAIAGKDGKFTWTDAAIIDNKVHVTIKDVKEPVTLRYAWASNPIQANLVNSKGLPASPFEYSLR